MEPDIQTTVETDEFNMTDYDMDEAMSTFYWEKLLPPLLVYSFTFILGITGNIIIIFTITTCRRMKNITNVFLASLASSDLLIIVLCIPVKLARVFSYTWSMGLFMCKFVSYIQNVSCFCSVFTLTAISIERYYAIMHPVKAKYICTLSQARRVLISIWIASFICSTPIIFMQILYPVGRHGYHFWCVRNWYQEVWWRLYELYMLIFILVIPGFIMTMSYAYLSVEVWGVLHPDAAVNRNGNISPDKIPMHQLGVSPMNRHSRKGKEDGSTVKQIVKMLVVVVMLFFFCWTPLLMVNVLTAFGYLDELNVGYMMHLRLGAHLMAYLNSCMNPIVYGFMSRNFRTSVKIALSCCRRESRSRRFSVTQTHVSGVRWRMTQPHSRSPSPGTRGLIADV